MALAFCATCMNIDLIGRPSSTSAFVHVASLPSALAPTTRIVLPPQSGLTFSSNRQRCRPRDTSNHIVASQPSFSWAVFSSSQNYIDGTISVTRQQPPKADRSSKISSRLVNDPKKTKKKRRDNIVDSDSFASTDEDFASIELSLYYRIYNPNYCCRSSDSGGVESGDKNKLGAKAPIVILHGGP